jgi:hypothetical protein
VKDKHKVQSVPGEYEEQKTLWYGIFKETFCGNGIIIIFVWLN